MDSFDVIISPKALAQLNDYIDYIQYTLMNFLRHRYLMLYRIEGQTAFAILIIEILDHVDHKK